MHPVLLRLGPFTVWSYGTMLALAFVLGTHFALREARARGIGEEHVYNLALLFAIAGVVGSRLLHVLLNLSYYLAHPVEILDLTNGGLAMHGGFTLAILAGIWYTRWQRVDAWELADFLPKWGVLGIGIVRIGCLLKGCCFGVPGNAPWAFDCSLLHDVPRHPTQIYEMLLDFTLFGYLWVKRRHSHFKGWPSWVMVGGYSVIRAFVEIWRQEPRFWGPFKLGQLASIILAVAAFAMIPHLDRKRGPARTISG
ncbi:MAG: prolipoprotein diacylglyceryl transferase [Bacillota bacterium]|nr:prolipoprotein diacylglyceryl transferase [Bacillota bacterium]